jgi:hypothetical protein
MTTPPGSASDSADTARTRRGQAGYTVRGPACGRSRARRTPWCRRSSVEQSQSFRVGFAALCRVINGTVRDTTKENDKEDASRMSHRPSSSFGRALGVVSVNVNCEHGSPVTIGGTRLRPHGRFPGPCHGRSWEHAFAVPVAVRQHTRRDFARQRVPIWSDPLIDPVGKLSFFSNGSCLHRRAFAHDINVTLTPCSRVI